MATSAVNLPSFFGSDADFRTWAQGVHNALAAIGLVQAADTGQINLATVAKPAVVNTVAGYEIWRFADALQATAPVFVKVEYGTGGAVDRPSFFITVGSGTNGAGAINQQATARTQVQSGVSEVAGSTKPFDVSGDTGRAFVVGNQFPTSTLAAYAFFLDRTRDASGAATADGIVYGVVAQGAPSFTTIPFTGGVPALGAQPQSPTSGGVSSVGNNVIVSPLLAFLGKVFYTWFGAMNAADITGDVVFTAQMFGAAHTFRTVRCSSYSLAFLWE